MKYRQLRGEIHQAGYDLRADGPPRTFSNDGAWREVDTPAMIPHIPGDPIRKPDRAPPLTDGAQ